MKFSNAVFAFCLLIAFASCGGKSNRKQANEKDTLAIVEPDSVSMVKNKASAMLTLAKPFINNELSKWMQSFKGLHTDSLYFSHLSSFEQIDYQSTDSLLSFYPLYKTSLIFSPDSNQFIDLFSPGVSLEKRGKKVVAMSDVDQAVTLCNIQAKEWKRIAFFGPSAGLEETIWINTTQFIMAGMVHNDEGLATPLLLLGDAENKIFFWFEAKNTRPITTTYESSAMKKLNVDEWE
jgi:hypothetical protein